MKMKSPTLSPLTLVYSIGIAAFASAFCSSPWSNRVHPASLIKEPMTDPPSFRSSPLYAALGMAECKRSVSCTCGGVKLYIADCVPLFGAYCHCSICREITGNPYFWGTGFPTKMISLTRSTEDNLTAQKGKKGVRYTCKNCNTYVWRVDGDLSIIPGTLLNESNPEKAPPAAFHIFYDNRVVDVEDDLPKYAEGPGGEALLSSSEEEN